MHESDEVFGAFDRYRLVPVLVMDDLATVPVLADALKAGPLPLVEVTMRTPSSIDILRVLARDPALMVGAGTVLTTAQVDAVAEAGARFVISPGLDLEVCARALEHGLLPVPGVATATEIQSGLRAGLSLLKFFPAEALGGVSALRALSAAFADVRFVPSGGIGPANLDRYLDVESVVAVGGSWMVSAELLSSDEPEALLHAVMSAAAAARRA